MQALKAVHSYEVNVLCKLLHYSKKATATKYPQNIDIPLLFRWICGLWTAAVKHFIADSTWLNGILVEWAQNRFVKKWTINRLQASFLNQGKHNMGENASALNRYILVVLSSWQESFRNIGSWFYFTKHTRFEFLNEYIDTIDFNIKKVALES